MEKKKYTFLVIDDDPADVEILHRCLETISDWDVSLVAVTDPQKVYDVLEKVNPDLLFIDYLLGGQTGLELFMVIREAGCKKPVIMLTGHGSEEIAVKAMKAGAQDYLPKSNLSRDYLKRAILYAMEKSAMQAQIEEQRKELELLARTDSLTKLHNRRYFLDRLTQEFLRSIRYGAPLCLLMVDLDYFKAINDTHGHIVGDVVLTKVAELIQETVRASDLGGRYGGEEFCIFLTETHLEGARVIAERLRQNIEQISFFGKGENSFFITCSIGLAQWNDHIKDIPSFLKEADQALYAAKNAGRNRVVLASRIHS